MKEEYYSISKENQEFLFDFIMRLLYDARKINVVCDNSHIDDYLELESKFKELNLVSIREDYSIGGRRHNISVEALFPFGFLLKDKILEIFK